MAVAYAGLVAAWVYGVLNTGLTDVSEPHPVWGEEGGLLLFYGLHLALGILVGRWWVLVLVLLPVVPLATLGIVARLLGERVLRM